MDFMVVEKRNGKYIYEGSDGKWYGEGYDYAYDFSEGYALVKIDGKYYYVDKKFKQHGEGYDEADSFREGYAAVEKDGKWYYVDKDFNLHGEGYDFAWDFSKGYARVEKDGIEYRINKDFQIADEGEALRVAEQDIRLINEIAPECFLAEGFSEALNSIIHKHYAQKIEETTDLNAIKLTEEMEELGKLLESKKQEAKKLAQAKTYAKETLDKLFGNLNEKE